MSAHHVGNWNRRLISVDWTPDGNHLIYTSSQTDNGWPDQLWRVAIEGGEPEQLSLKDHTLVRMRVHPNGRKIAFQIEQGDKHDVWMLENFLPDNRHKPER